MSGFDNLSWANRLYHIVPRNLTRGKNTAMFTGGERQLTAVNSAN
jgi:hypothetical protein